MATGWRNWPPGEGGWQAKRVAGSYSEGEQCLQQGGCVLTAQQMQSLKMKQTRARELRKHARQRIWKRMGEGCGMWGTWRKNYCTIGNLWCLLGGSLSYNDTSMRAPIKYEIFIGAYRKSLQLASKFPHRWNKKPIMQMLSHLKGPDSFQRACQTLEHSAGAGELPDIQMGPKPICNWTVDIKHIKGRLVPG